MKTAALFLAIFSGLFLTSCEKEKLPKPTEAGKNTFGCKINGKNWVPHGGGGLLNATKPLHGGFFENDHTIFIRAYDNEETIMLYLKDVYAEGEYLLNFTTLSFPDNQNPNNYGLYSLAKDSIINFITNATYTGRVYITRRDPINKIISGTFEFTGVNTNSGKTMRISNGRFDITTSL